MEKEKSVILLCTIFQLLPSYLKDQTFQLGKNRSSYLVPTGTKLWRIHSLEVVKIEGSA